MDLSGPSIDVKLKERKKERKKHSPMHHPLETCYHSVGDRLELFTKVPH